MFELIEKYAEARSANGPHSTAEETAKAREAMLSSLESIKNTFSPSNAQVQAIVTAYVEGVREGQKAAKDGIEVKNPYSAAWNCDFAWAIGHREGRDRVDDFEQDELVDIERNLSERIDGYAESRHVNGTYLYNEVTAKERSSLLKWLTSLINLRKKAKENS